MDLPDLHLVSFPVCPFVQRSLITLRYKELPHEITYINLADPPEWFLERSPLGKVPILVVNQNTIVFESEVINEYVDELAPPSLLPEDPLARAQARAWIEFLSEQTAVLHRWMLAGDEDAAVQAREQACAGLERLEALVASDPLFTEREFSLIDAALAPLLMRYTLVRDPASPWDPETFPHLAARWERLGRLPAVRESVREDFALRLADFLESKGGVIVPRLTALLRDQ
ncbi:MAG: glutathione S-transferase family protein [Pseudomonadota bacterium]